MTHTSDRTPSTDESGIVRTDRPGEESLTVAIAETVATAEGVDVTELEPLHHSVDTEALERLFSSCSAGDRDTGSVTFEYSHSAVTVSATGAIEADPSA